MWHIGIRCLTGVRRGWGGSLGPVTCLQLNYVRVLVCGGGGLVAKLTLL